MSSRMPVSCWIVGGIGSGGATSSENVATMAPRSMRAAPSSMIPFDPGQQPVASISTVTKVAS